jgi:hypothetical protein
MSWSIELAEDIEYSGFFGYSGPLAICLSHDDQLSRSFLTAADVQFLKALSQIISRDVVEIMPQHDSRSLCTLCPSFFLHHTYCERRRRRPEFSSLDIDAGALDLLMWFRRIGYITGSAEIFLCCREKKARIRWRAERFVHSRRQGLFDYYWKNHWELWRTWNETRLYRPTLLPFFRILPAAKHF